MYDFPSIFELQQRTIPSFIQVFLLGPLLTLVTPIYFSQSLSHLFFTYIIPILPFVMVADGYTSVCAFLRMGTVHMQVQIMRTRSPSEIHELIAKSTTPEERKDWIFEDDCFTHVPVIGKLYYFYGRRVSTLNQD